MKYVTIFFVDSKYDLPIAPPGQSHETDLAQLVRVNKYYGEINFVGIESD